MGRWGWSLKTQDEEKEHCLEYVNNGDGLWGGGGAVKPKMNTLGEDNDGLWIAWPL